MLQPNTDFRWSFHCNNFRALGLKNRQAVLKRAVEEGTIKHVGRGTYRLTGKKMASGRAPSDATKSAPAAAPGTIGSANSARRTCWWLPCNPQPERKGP